MRHPTRTMRDGRTTTCHTHDVVLVSCDNPEHVRCFEAVTSWAGNPIPKQDSRWHIYLSKAGVWCLLGPLVGLESSQFETGLKRRAVNRYAEMVEAGEADYCEYSARHRMTGVPATTDIDCGPVAGIVSSCQACADLYDRLKG